MSKVSAPQCRWDAGEDCDEFLFEDCEIMARWLTMDFGYRFFFELVLDVRSDS